MHFFNLEQYILMAENASFKINAFNHVLNLNTAVQMTATSFLKIHDTVRSYNF